MTTNPAVNRYLHDKAMDNIDHALGRPVFPLRETYRNRFAVDIASAKAASFAASPNWQLAGTHGDMAFYAVTQAGRQALADHLASLSPAWRAYRVRYDGIETVVPAKNRRAARYAVFLDVRDVCADIAFLDFAKACRVRRAR